MRTSPSTLALACALAFHAGAAQAATTEEEELALAYGDKGVVSIATGNRQPLRRAPAVASVITAQDILTMGATDLDEVLETVPGIHVSRSNQVYGSLYVVRGIYSEFNPQTLVLQNGVPLTTLFVGNKGNLWVSMPLENVARIEVIRGPGSALYGADAFAGVINIITKSAADTPGTELGLRAGSFDSRDGWFQYGGQVGSLQVSGYLRAGHTGGFSRTIEADAQSALDTLFGTQASLTPGPVNTGYQALDGSLELGFRKLKLRSTYLLRHDLGTGSGVASALDPVGRGRGVRLLLDLSLSELDLGHDWKLTLGASHQRYRQAHDTPLRLFPPGAFGGAFPEGMFGAPNAWERHTRLSAVIGYTGFARHTLRAGVGHDDLDLYRTQELKNFSFVQTGPFIGLPVPTPGAQIVEFPVQDSFLAPHRRRVSHAHVQDEWAFARDWTLTAGVRRDHYSDFGNTTNPRLALVWDASLDLTAKLMYGRAFRAPAFLELYSINNPVNRGNPGLEPETIRTLEAAFSWQARPDTEIKLNLFDYRARNMIRTTDIGNGIAMFANLGAQRGRGGELEGAWDAGAALRLTGHYAYLQATDERTGANPGYAPRHKAYARADWRIGAGWLLGTQAQHVAGRARPPGDARPPVADHTTVDLTLRTGRIARDWELAASVRNLFDADVREPSLAPGTSLPYDLPMASRSFYLQLVLRL